MPKAYANRLCFLSDRRFGPFHIVLATWAPGVLAFEWALSSRKSSLVHGLRTGAFLFGLFFLAGWSTRLNYLCSVRARPTTSGRKIRPGPNAKSDGIGAIGFGAEEGHFIRSSVDVTRNSAFYAARVRGRAAGRAPRSPRRCAARGSVRMVTWRKHCQAKSPRSAFTAAPNHDRSDEVRNAGQLQASRRTPYR